MLQGMHQGGLVACVCQALLPGLLVSLWPCFDCLFASPKFTKSSHLASSVYILPHFVRLYVGESNRRHGLVRPSGGSRFFSRKDLPLASRTLDLRSNDRPMTWGTACYVRVGWERLITLVSRCFSGQTVLRRLTALFLFRQVSSL